LISGVAMAMKAHNPNVRVIGVESSGAPGMKKSVESGEVVTLDRVDCIIDGLRVKRVGQLTYEVVRDFVDEIVTLPDERIFDAVVWLMHYTKLVTEGAAASTAGALLEGLIDAPKGSRVVCVLSGGNVNLDQLKGLRWN
jgi:threonine dehydratase